MCVFGDATSNADAATHGQKEWTTRGSSQQDSGEVIEGKGSEIA
jgi:hypothetical protein